MQERLKRHISDVRRENLAVDWVAHVCLSASPGHHVGSDAGSDAARGAADAAVHPQAE